MIYFYHNGAMPLFLVTMFAKNEQSDITAADRNDFKRMTAILVDQYKGQNDE